MPETEKSEHSGSEKAQEDAREDIIRHYETGGRDDTNNIGEAEFDIHYIHYDRYGFVHDLRLNENPRQSSSDKKWLEKEKTREEKWITMITDVKHWFTMGTRSYQKMTDRVWKVKHSDSIYEFQLELIIQGVPDKMRGTVWRILLNVDNAKMKQQGTYSKMK